MYKEFLNINDDEILLTYMSDAFLEDSAKSDILYIYEKEVIENKIKLWEKEVMEDLDKTRFTINDAYSEDGISLSALVYSHNGEDGILYDDTEQNRLLMKEIEEKARDGIDGFEVEDVLHSYARVTLENNELDFSIYYNCCYQSYCRYVTIKKIKKKEVRYCIIVERPYNSKECDHILLAGPFTDSKEAKKLVNNFSDETDIYGRVRKPIIVAVPKDSEWLKWQLTENKRGE